MASMDIEVFPPDRLISHERHFRCALGRGGARAEKHEGDGATPVGRWPLRSIMYRPDRIAAPRSGLPTRPISPHDGWCDDPHHVAYNTLVTKPFAASHEDLWREDHVYDVIVELGYNDSPPRAGLGSAIFMHVARPGYTATEGCIALAREDLLAVLSGCGMQTALVIHPPA